MSFIHPVIAVFIAAIASVAFGQTNPPYDVSTWKKGDLLKYEIVSETWGSVGSYTKRVVKETEDSVWVKSNWTFTFWGVPDQDSLIELSKKNGEMLTKYVNGQQETPDVMFFNQLGPQFVSVPAGDFDCDDFEWELSGDLAGAKNLVVCLNPAASAMDGTIQMKADWRGDRISYNLVDFVKH